MVDLSDFCLHSDVMEMNETAFVMLTALKKDKNHSKATFANSLPVTPRGTGTISSIESSSNYYD